MPTREQIAQATREALRTLLRRLHRSLEEIEQRPGSWATRWTALKLSARRTLEEQEATMQPVAVIATETARAMLAEMHRLEGAEGGDPSNGSEPAAARRWHAIKRWLASRAVLHEHESP